MLAIRASFVLLLSCFAVFADNLTNLYVGQALYVGQVLTTVASVTSGVEVADTFTGADSNLSAHNTTTGNYAWVKASGSGNINLTNNTANDVGAGGSGSHYYVNHTISTSDYAAQVVITSSGTDDVRPAIAIRCDGAAAAIINGYGVIWFPSSSLAGMYKFVNGSRTQLGSYYSTTGLTQTIKIQASGTTISATCNGNSIASVTDSDISAAGYIAIGAGIAGFNGTAGSSTTYYDNLTMP